MMQATRLCPFRRIAVFSMAIVVGLIAHQATADQLSSVRNTKTVQAVRQAEPAVVNIEGNKPATTTVSGSRKEPHQVNGMGAGVIIDSRGYILTNQHVVQDVGRIEVTLHSGRQFVGKLIARDPETDLALIKVDSQRKLPVIRCGTSSDLMRGEPVIAIGNPYGYHDTVTVGIISALHRDIPVNGVQDYPNLIQTDASINPGNSGGPLLNAEGSMIGINAAVRIGAQGIGFAIPVDRVVEIAAKMIAGHRRGSFESQLQVKTIHSNGDSRLKVVRSKQGLVKTGDILTSVAGRSVANRLDYELALLGKPSNSKVEMEILRGDESLVASVGLVPRSSARTQLASTGNVRDQVYRKLGVRLTPANAAQVRRVDASYKGGLRVTSVRQNSPAFAAQIQPGDILVGLMEWQTPAWYDIGWIMKRDEMKTASAPKFHIMRDGDVFWGTLDTSKATVR